MNERRVANQQGYGLSVRASGFAGALLLLGMAGGVTALVGEGLDRAVVLRVGLVTMLVATAGAGVLALVDARRRGRSFWGALWESIREVFRWLAFLF